MLNNDTIRGLLLTTCAAATLVPVGCRSVPGMNMFARRSEPSPEALAGTGPTATYPAPPSSSATPEAIASIAGGTGTPSPTKKPGAVTAQVAGYNVTPGYATPASVQSPPQTNMAAAQANGVYGGGSYARSKPSETPASGYTFGGKSFTPKSSLDAATTASATAPPSYPTPKSSYAASNSSYGLPGATASSSQLPVPSTSYSTPPPAASSTAPANSGESFASGNGFSLPPSAGTASAAIAPPATSGNAPVSYNLPSSSTASAVAPQQDSPAFSTAKAVSEPTSTSTTYTPGSTSGTSGYLPGSTGKAGGYPSGSESPTTSGSFYR